MVGWGGRGLGRRNLGHQGQDEEDLQEDGQLTGEPGSRGRDVCKRAAFRRGASGFFFVNFPEKTIQEGAAWLSTVGLEGQTGFFLDLPV